MFTWEGVTAPPCPRCGLQHAHERCGLDELAAARDVARFAASVSLALALLAAGPDPRTRRRPPRSGYVNRWRDR